MGLIGRGQRLIMAIFRRGQLSRGQMPEGGRCLTFTSHCAARQRCTEVSRRCHVTLNYASRSPQLLGYSTRATCEIFERFLELCSTLTSSVARTLLVGSICGPPAAISCSYRDTGVRCSVARRPGTCYQTTCEIHHVPLTVFAGT